jgi:hypothetical protein
MTGYMGRIGLYEILLMSPELKNDQRPDRPGPDSRAGDPRGHEAAAPVGGLEGGRRHHDPGGSGEGRPPAEVAD